MVDSYGWIEYFSGGPLAGRYATHIEKANKSSYLTPSIVLYEVYKQVKRALGYEKALEAYAYVVAYTTIVPLDEQIALEAAEKSLESGLGTADAVVKATAERHSCAIITSDEHFKGMNGVTFIK